MLTITSRDDEILDSLTLRVRLLTLDQVARCWWADAKSARQSALNRLRQLELADKVHLFELPAHPELPLTEPEAIWKPKAPIPDFHRLSYRLSSRWKQPPILHLGVIASRASGRHYGGWGGRKPRSTERTHDLHMAAVFLLKRARDPESVVHWMSEEKVREGQRQRPRDGRQHVPDAIVKRPKRTVIEFGGSYPADKLASFHDYCAAQGWPYEIW